MGRDVYATDSQSQSQSERQSNTFFFFVQILTSPVDNPGKKKNRATP